MTEEKDNLLCARYPKIFSDRYGDPRETLMCFGFECDDGWFDIIDSLCGCIQSHVDNSQARGCMTPEEFDSKIQVRAAQVKEKFGGLRFYVDNSDDYVNGIIQMAETQSLKTCERCGCPGHPRRGGWTRTLCDNCHTAKMKK